MSNAEEKSSKASTDMLPLLRERNRSLTNFRRAVWRILKDDNVASISRLLVIYNTYFQ